LLPAIGIEVGVPSEAELLRVVRVDSCQRTEALLAVGASIAQPVRSVAVGAAHPLGADVGGTAGSLSLADTEDQRGRCSQQYGQAANLSRQPAFDLHDLPSLFGIFHAGNLGALRAVA